MPSIQRGKATSLLGYETKAINYAFGNEMCFLLPSLAFSFPSFHSSYDDNALRVQILNCYDEPACNALFNLLMSQLTIAKPLVAINVLLERLVRPRSAQG